jgi:hypothetical protein
LIVNNGGGILGQAFAWVLFKLAIYLLCVYLIGEKYMPVKEAEQNNKIKQNQTIGEKIKRGFWSVNTGIDFSFLSKFLLAIQIDILIAVFVNLRSFWVKPFKILWNSAISLAIVVIYLKFMFDVVINSVKLEIHKRKFGSYKS